MENREQLIRERAYRLWLEEGCPEGRAESHWEMARELQAQEEGVQETTEPVGRTGDRSASAPAEPLEAIDNQGDFPSLTDQGDRSAGPGKAAKRSRRQPAKS